MKTEKIESKSDKRNLIEEVKRIQKIEPAKEFNKQYEDQLSKKQKEKANENNNEKKDPKTGKGITPQQAYEMQKSNTRAGNIIKNEKEKVREFKKGLNPQKGYAKYKQHLEEVANMQERKYQEQHSKEQTSEHEEK